MENTIIINGVKMTMKEYKAYRKEKEAEKNPKKSVKRKKAVVKEISAVALQIESMLKQMSVLKSVQVYRNHAYRSWGTIANEILSYYGIRKPMAEYCVRFGELNTLLTDIQKMAKRNEKAAYQYVDKMAWKLDDMRLNIIDMTKAVNESGVCQRFKDHEAINGKGRQLGLQTIILKALKSMDSIDKAIKRLREIADDGINALDYERHLSFNQRVKMRLN
jgi:hypothetical protein